MHTCHYETGDDKRVTNMSLQERKCQDRHKPVTMREEITRQSTTCHYETGDDKTVTNLHTSAVSMGECLA